MKKKNDKKTKIHLAMDTLISALRRDEQYYYSWQANIAMAFVDTFNEQGVKGYFIHNNANLAAKRFLNILIRKK